MPDDRNHLLADHLVARWQMVDGELHYVGEVPAPRPRTDFDDDDDLDELEAVLDLDDSEAQQ